MPPTAADIRRLARLAALALDEAEVERLTGELAGILAHIEVVVEASAGVPHDPAPAGRPRSDVRRHGPSLAIPPADFAPAWRDGYFVTPRPVRLDDGAAPVVDAP
jgi:Asp-tRNA(Asn)/Glu-tRNA(Gln) amidotransferase C subunit